MRINYWRGSDGSNELEGSGGLVESREIELKGNNTTKVHLSNLKNWDKEEAV
jgi:hypothetical protein